MGCRFAVRRFLSTSPAALVCTASGLVAASSRASPTRTINEIPAPKGAIPLLGHLHQLVGKDTRGKFELFESLHKKLGPIVRLKLPRKFSTNLTVDSIVQWPILDNFLQSEKIFC